MSKFLKYIIIALVAVLLLMFGLGFYNRMRAKKIVESPITAMAATNEKIYTPGGKIDPGDFTVYEVHGDDNYIELSKADYTCEPTVAALNGATTEVTITKKSDPTWSCVIEVKNKRDEIASFYVGYPNLEDVKATIYSNGELEFTGSGNVKNYEKGTMPWKKYEDVRTYPISSVIFQDGVSPVIMDYWFEGEKSLTYINKIPSSVQSLSYTFSNCPALVKGPDWSECKELTNLTGTFSKDTSLTYVYPIPASVTVMDSMCSECSALENAPDMTGATNVIYMQKAFYACTSLYDIGQLPSQTQNLAETFFKCINLTVAPEIPSSVSTMAGTFQKCSSMQKASIIPGGVKDLTSTYAECPKLCGELIIHANPDKYSGFLSKSVISVSLNLTGNSQMLNILGLTKDDTSNVTVNGVVPVKETQ